MTPTDILRRELENELHLVRTEEQSTETELRFYLKAISESNPDHASFEYLDLGAKIMKIEKFMPCFEAMVEDSRKLTAQVEDCRSLSDRLSALVRRLDLVQIRAQQALACTEDVINLKECKAGVQQAIEDGNIHAAVSFIRQFHDIEVEAAKASDDYGAMQQAERELKQLVQKQFNLALSDSNISIILSLCPFLQTLGLENEARDNFLSFMETNVFIGVSADVSAADNVSATDAATGYAQALSSIFNTTCSILQQYLPSVIQGLENSLADIYFIRRLHNRCEREAGLVLKRYMKYRNIREMISSLKSITYPSPKYAAAATDTHMILDELALMIQYCCSYNHYLRQLCVGAEARKRGM